MVAHGANGKKGRVTLTLFALLLLSSQTILVSCQDNYPYGGRSYARDGVYVPPGTSGHQTYVYKDRRYGYQPSYLDPVYRGPTRAPEDRFRYGEVPDHSELPGILGGWREDLQGKQRPDSKDLDRDIFVDTNYGRVQGFKVYLYDHPESRHRPWSLPVERVTANVNVFLGIPYAMPPVKEGRFKPPQPRRSWELLQAVDWGPACPQPSSYTGATKGIRDVDEDCLYLNVFSPKTGSGVGKPYPVMFYIHGGEFIHGASNQFPAHTLAGFYNVVVVSINYRLGALGFLSTGDENSPGNYGIHDQAMALQWVHENIRGFGGMPDSITLFGPGAGAASAGLLMVAPRTRHLVSKVIAQSGSAVADWAMIVDKYRAQNTSRVYAEKMGCSIESSWKLVQCLKDGRSSLDLGNSELKPHVGTFPWAPVLDVNFTVSHGYYNDWRASDWHFFGSTVEESIRAGNFSKNLVYMASVTTQEAAYMIQNNATLRKNNYFFDTESFDKQIWDLVLGYNYTLNPYGVYEAIKYMYTYWPDPKNSTLIRDQYINLLSDFHYVAPFDKMAKLLVEKNVPVYLYVFNTSIEALNPPHWRRVPHDTEHLLLTGAPFMDTQFFPEKWGLERDAWTDNDRNMSHLMMKMYSNFAHYGNPTPAQILGLHFEVAKNGYLKYLNLNTTYNSTILFNYRQIESAFWSQYLPTVIGRLVPTYPPVTEYWWEPKQPLQIAFWSMSTACLLLIVLSVVCCMLWRNAKRQSDHYYSGDILMVREDEHSEGIENLTRASKENMYEYRDAPSPASKPGIVGRIPRQNETKLHERLAQNRKFSSTPSLRSNSNVSLKDMRSEGFVTSSPNGNAKPIGKASSQTTLTKGKARTTRVIQGVPQTAV